MPHFIPSNTKYFPTTEIVLNQGQEATNHRHFLGHLTALAFHYAKVYSADGCSEKLLLGSGPWVMNQGSLPLGVSWMASGSLTFWTPSWVCVDSVTMIPNLLGVESPSHSQVLFRIISCSSEGRLGTCHMGVIYQQGNRFQMTWQFPLICNGHLKLCWLRGTLSLSYQWSVSAMGREMKQIVFIFAMPVLGFNTSGLKTPLKESLLPKGGFWSSRSLSWHNA